MRRFISGITFFVIGAFLSACSTPQPIRKSAELTVTELAVLKEEVSTFTDSANSNARWRIEALGEAAEDQFKLKNEDKDALYIGLADDKRLLKTYKDLVELSNRFQQRDTDGSSLKKAYVDQLNRQLQELKISAELFKKTEVALAMLADEESAKEQISFIFAYMKDVRAKFKEKRDSENSGNAP